MSYSHRGMGVVGVLDLSARSTGPTLSPRMPQSQAKTSASYNAPTLYQPQIGLKVAPQATYMAPTAHTAPAGSPHVREYGLYRTARALLDLYLKDLGRIRPSVAPAARALVNDEIRRVQQAQNLFRSVLMHPNGWTARDLGVLAEIDASGGLPSSDDIALMPTVGQRRNAENLQRAWSDLKSSLLARGRWPKAKAPTARPGGGVVFSPPGLGPGVRTGGDKAAEAEREVERQRRELEEQRRRAIELEAAERARAEAEERARVEAEFAPSPEVPPEDYYADPGAYAPTDYAPTDSPPTPSPLLPAASKDKEFPWLWVFGGAAVLGVGGYLLLR